MNAIADIQLVVSAWIDWYDIRCPQSRSTAGGRCVRGGVTSLG